MRRASMRSVMRMRSTSLRHLGGTGLRGLASSVQAVLRIALPAAPAVIEQLERLHDEYGRHLRARNFRGVHESNDAFHLAMFAACGNRYLVESIKHYMWLSLLVRSKKTADYDYAVASARDHHLMIQLLKGTDSWALAQLCVDHLQGAKTAYLQAAQGAAGT